MLSAVEQSSHVCSLPPGHINHQHTCQSQQAERERLEPQGIHWDRGSYRGRNKKVRKQRSSEELDGGVVRNLGDIHKRIQPIKISIITDCER